MCSAWVTHMKFGWLNGSCGGFNPGCEGKGSSKSYQPNVAEWGRDGTEMGVWGENERGEQSGARDLFFIDESPLQESVLFLPD